MLERTRNEARPAVTAAAALVALLPGTALAADDLPPPPLPAAPVIDAPPLPAVLDSPGDAAVAPPVAAAAATCAGAGRRSSPGRQRVAVRCLVNRARARARLPGYRSSGTLARAARRHARDMARARYFAHQRSGGPSPARRARAAGWRGSGLNEAIAYGCGGFATPLAVVRSWLASPPHAAILLSTDLRKMGVGVAPRAPVGCPGATYVLDAGRGS